MTKKLITHLILCCLFFSCQKKNKQTELVLPTTITQKKLEANSINLDTLNSLFDDLYRFKKNYAHKYNLEKNYPNLISRIEILKDSTDNKIYEELLKLTKSYSISKNYSDKETDSLNKTIIAKIFSKNELTEIRNLYNSKISIDTTKSLDFNLKRLTERYKRIDFYFRKQYYFRDSLMPKFWEICPLYYKIINEIASQKESKSDSLKNHLLQEKVSFVDNKAFIKSIILTENDTLKPSFLKNISPIFEKINGQFGIYNMNTNYYGDKLIFEKSSIPKKLKENNNISKFLQDFNVLNHKDSTKIYAYSTKERLLIKVLGFGYQPDECIEPYYVFPINAMKEGIEKLFFSSTYKLDLEFDNYPQIDSLINNQYSNICIDCPNGMSRQKSYARLKGYKNIYFTLTAEEVVDDTDTIIRAIYFVENNEIIILWIEEYDSFGCACL